VRAGKTRRQCELLLARGVFFFAAAAEPTRISGQIRDPQYASVDTHIKLRNSADVVMSESTSDTRGSFAL